MDTVTKTLIAYRQQIKAVTDKYSASVVSMEIEQMSCSIDEFIESYEQMERAQKRFDRYLKGMNLSYSPEKSSLLVQSPPTAFTDLVSSCIGDI